MAWVNTKCFHCVPLIWLLGRVAGLLIQATECRSGTAHAHTHFRSIGWCLRPHVIVQPSLPVQLLGYPDGTQWINARLVDYLSINKHLRGAAEGGYLRTLPLGSSADDTAATCVVAVSLLVGLSPQACLPAGIISWSGTSAFYLLFQVTWKRSQPMREDVTYATSSLIG